VEKLNLNELLRYGFAGTVFLILIIAAYDEPRFVMSGEYGNGILATALLTIGLTAGSVIYTLHRAIPYPVLYWVFAKLSGRKENTMELDIKRWRNVSKSGSLQPRLGEWAAQLHFLYCIGWSGLVAIVLGKGACWSRSDLWCAVLSASLCFLFAGMWHHYRYQKWEKRVFIEDGGA